MTDTTRTETAVGLPSTECRTCAAIPASRCPSRPSRISSPPPRRASRSGRQWCSANRACAGLARVHRRGRCHGRRPAGARPAPRGSRRHLVAEPGGMAADPVRHRARRPGHGQHQSGLPAGRAGVRAQQGRLQGHHRGGNLQDLALPEMLQTLAPELAASAPGVAGGASAGAALGDPHGRGTHAGHAQFRRDGARRRRATCRTGRTDGPARPQRPDQYPVHQRHHRRPKGAT